MPEVLNEIIDFFVSCCAIINNETKLLTMESKTAAGDDIFDEFDESI